MPNENPNDRENPGSSCCDTSYCTFFRLSGIILFLASSLPYVIYILYDQWFNNGKSQELAVGTAVIPFVNTLMQTFSLMRYGTIIQYPDFHQPEGLDKVKEYLVKALYCSLMIISGLMSKLLDDLSDKKGLDSSFLNAVSWGERIAVTSLFSYVFCLISAGKLEERQTAANSAKVPLLPGPIPGSANSRSGFFKRFLPGFIKRYCSSATDISPS